MWFQIQHCHLNLRNHHLESRLTSWSRRDSSCLRRERSRVQVPDEPLYFWVSLVAQTVKNPPTMQETWVWSLVWEDPLEKSTATHSSILAWRIPMDKEAWRLQSIGSQRVRHDWATKQHSSHQRRIPTIIWKGPSFSNYLCEDRFSSYTSTKTTYSNRLNIETDTSLHFLLSKILKRFIET